ncbi:MalY/PatB family protein [Corynebacterium sp. CNJ-954]|uniref:MalY/PatB family protein n=1 Tax=Corynebacterium sp. CNJ-954 TaxID=1904962 RepID=UPI001C9E6FE1|nr:aminotransferase class I/II-fold pyridoxal phosphate-dependent enzyme [Corynebacterium sp. CNJ-954]
MDFGTSPNVQSELKKAVDTPLLGYLPKTLSDEMATETARYVKDNYGWSVPTSDIHPISDVTYATRLAIEHYSRPGSPVIVPTPSYMPFLTVPGDVNREVIQVPMIEKDGTMKLDLEGIERAFLAGGNLLILCNPYNPIGRVFTRAELDALSIVVERNEGRVFADEIHAPLVYSPHKHVPYASISRITAGHTVTAYSASKAWNIPGLKAAQFVVTNEQDREVWDRIGYRASHTCSILGVIANTVAYSEDREWQKDILEYLDGNRKYLGRLLKEYIPQIGYQEPEGTYIGWLDVRSLGFHNGAADFFRERAGVALTDGEATGTAGVGYLRLIFATPRPILEEAVERMALSLRAQ